MYAIQEWQIDSIEGACHPRTGGTADGTAGMKIPPSRQRTTPTFCWTICYLTLVT